MRPNRRPKVYLEGSNYKLDDQTDEEMFFGVTTSSQQVPTRSSLFQPESLQGPTVASIYKTTLAVEDLGIISSCCGKGNYQKNFNILIEKIIAILICPKTTIEKIYVPEIAEIFLHQQLAVILNSSQFPIIALPVQHTTASGIAPELTSLAVAASLGQQAEVQVFSALAKCFHSSDKRREVSLMVVK
ncbi:hypothetical protein M5K25_000897 [Dendrobium thyrsiflorum]|uniref:Uncharacterized protein n=1 Tax=Dendrobium thyrsiflorum TaxID=117978 RepID=A0ABD0VXK9_DENTH